jgi:hypothetical protein
MKFVFHRLALFKHEIMKIQALCHALQYQYLQLLLSTHTHKSITYHPLNDTLPPNQNMTNLQTNRNPNSTHEKKTNTQNNVQT